MKESEELVKRIEVEINNTASGELRNLLCDANIVIQALNLQNVRKRFSWSDFFIGVMAGIFAGVMIIAKLL